MESLSVALHQLGKNKTHVIADHANFGSIWFHPSQLPLAQAQKNSLVVYPDIHIFDLLHTIPLCILVSSSSSWFGLPEH